MKLLLGQVHNQGIVTHEVLTLGVIEDCTLGKVHRRLVRGHRNKGWTKACGLHLAARMAGHRR
jgi:hypothetical protein